MLSILHPIADGVSWRALIQRLPPELRDVHYSPEYAEVQRMLGFSPYLAVYAWEKEFVLMPFVLKRNDIDGRLAFDIASPYSYGGPLCSLGSATSAPHLHEWFRDAFEKYMCSIKVTTEFCALHPLLADHQLPLLYPATPSTGKNVVAIDIASWKPENCRGDRIEGFARAEKENVRVHAISIVPSDVERFIELYRTTMLRKSAHQRWYFPDEYLRAYFKMPQARLFIAEIEGWPIEVMSLVLIEHGRAYYHLTGNAMGNPKARANDALIAAIIDYCAVIGVKTLHLGGGVTSDPADTLLTYKASFGGRLVPTHNYFRVFDNAAYADLTQRKRAQEIVALGRTSESTYLPIHLRDNV